MTDVEDFSLERKAEIKQVFQLFDTDGDNFLTALEFKVALHSLGFVQENILSLEEVEDNGRISYSEFEKIAMEQLTKRSIREELLQVFNLIDSDKTGKISMENMKTAIAKLGDDISDSELKSMIDEFDMDGDGEINQEEFLAIMTRE